MIRVVATVFPLAHTRDEVLDILIGLLEPTRAEEGCAFYDVHVGDDPLQLTFIEQWATEELLDQHLQSKHIQTAIAALDGLLSEPTAIRRFQIVSGTEKT